MSVPFRGSGIAIVTPFRGGEVDYEAFEKLIEFQLSGGTDCIVALGTTGEAATLNATEKDAVAQFVVRQVAGRAHVMIGSGSNSTAATIEASKRMEQNGADSLLVVTPYYNKATQAGLVAHYTAVADAVSTPVVLYNVPSRTSMNLLPPTVAQLAEHPGIVGIKEASGDIVQIMELFRLVRGKIAIYSGNDDHVYPMLALGGDGVISVSAHIIPAPMHELVAAYHSGDHQRSLAIQEKYNPLHKLLFTEVNPIPIKAALAAMDLCSDELRLPLTTITPGNRDILVAQMRELGLVK